MKKALLLLIAFVLLSTYSLAHGDDECDMLEINSRNTQELLKEVPLLNSMMESCHYPLEGSAKSILKNEKLLASIGMNDGTAETIVVTTKDGELVGMKRDVGSGTLLMSMNECTLDAILSDGNPLGVFAYAYLNGKASLSATSFGGKIKLLLLKPIMKMRLKKIQKKADMGC